MRGSIVVLLSCLFLGGGLFGRYQVGRRQDRYIAKYSIAKSFNSNVFIAIGVILMIVGLWLLL